MTALAPPRPDADALAPSQSRPVTGARLASAGYVALFVLAIVANFMVLDPLLSAGSPSASVDALRESESLVRFGAVAFLAIFLIDLVVAWALHLVFRPVHADLSLFAAWCRLGYTLMLGAALTFLFLALVLVSDPQFAPTSNGAVLLALRAFEFTWVAGLSAFGLHLITLGLLLMRASGGPRLLAGALMMAGAAYIIDTVAHLAIADYEAWSGLFLAIVAVPSIIGELGLTIWLLLIASGRRSAPRA